MEGDSLFSLIKEKKETLNLEAYVNFFRSWAIRTEDWKFIYDEIDNTIELYNIKNDPEELKNLKDERPDILKMMFSKLN